MKENEIVVVSVLGGLLLFVLLCLAICRKSLMKWLRYSNNAPLYHYNRGRPSQRQGDNMTESKASIVAASQPTILKDLNIKVKGPEWV